MSKKVWQKLIDQNMVTITELKEVTDQMFDSQDGLIMYPKYHRWAELNKKRAALITDLQVELDAAYVNQPVKSVARQATEVKRCLTF